MADVFEWKKGLSSWRQRLWTVIDETPSLDWLLLTKRPHLVRRLTPWKDDWPENVWLGTTVENQRWVNKRLPHLSDIPAHTRFLSCEPLLGEIDLDDWLERKTVHWVIAGGESGPKARPSDPKWFYAVRDQCITHATPFHFKQWGDVGADQRLPKHCASINRGRRFLLDADGKVRKEGQRAHLGRQNVGRHPPAVNETVF